MVGFTMKKIVFLLKSKKEEKTAQKAFSQDQRDQQKKAYHVSSWVGGLGLVAVIDGIFNQLLQLILVQVFIDGEFGFAAGHCVVLSSCVCLVCLVFLFCCLISFFSWRSLACIDPKWRSYSQPTLSPWKTILHVGGENQVQRHLL